MTALGYAIVLSYCYSVGDCDVLALHKTGFADLTLCQASIPTAVSLLTAKFPKGVHISGDCRRLEDMCGRAPASLEHTLVELCKGSPSLDNE